MHLSWFVTLEKRWAQKIGGERGLSDWNVERKAGYFKISLKLHATNFICLSMFAGV